MASRLAEQGALQDALTNNESNPPRLSLAGYIRGLFLDWSANPYNPLSRLTARGRLLGYFWDNGAIGLSMDFANQSFIVKDGTLQSKSFSDIVTFSRTSNATVTRADGTIGFAPHNLLTFSEQFDNAAWGKFNGFAVTANTHIAPNGTQTADTITFTSGTSVTRITTATLIAGTTYTFSIWAQSLTGNTSLFVDLGDGTPVSRTVSSSFERVTFTLVAGSAGSFIDILSGGAATMVWWGAQLEIGSTATTYNPTTVKNLLGYSELFDNAAWTKSNSFVQTNLLTYSEAFDNAAWTKGNSSISANATLAPNGYQTADKLIENTATSTHQTSQSYSSSSGKYTFSAYLKAAERTTAYLQLSDGATGSVFAIANLSAGTVSKTTTGSWTNTDVSITPVGNGWFRVVALGTQGAGATIFPTIALGSNTSGYTGDGTSGIYIWGAQLVQGSVAGDYRRTDAAALPIFYPNHNGVVCAQKLVENTAASASHLMAVQFIPTSGAIYTASIYLKKAERNFAFIGFNGGSLATTFISADLTTGEMSFGTFLNYTSVPVGNGWWRFSITLNSTGTSASFFEIRTSIDGVWANRNYTGDGTSGIYIFGAQLSDSASLDPYVLNAGAAPSAAAYYGPRFDYDPVTKEPKGLLIEEQRTNLALGSQEFNTGFWSKNNVSITADDINSPDGTKNADKMTASAGTAAHTITSSPISCPAGATISVYAKAGSANIIQLFIGGSAIPYANFNLADVTTTSFGSGSSSSIIPVGNGWVRCILSTTNTLATSLQIGIVTSLSSSRAESWSAAGTEDVYIWGAQAENALFATSYIPTAASQVTRTADVATIAGSNFRSWYNQNEGSVAAQFSFSQVSGFPSPFSVDGGTALGSISSNRIQFYQNSNSTALGFDVFTLGAGQANITFTGLNLTTNTKVVGAYKVNDFSAAVNNVLGTPDTSGITAIYDRLIIGRASPAPVATCIVKSISYYPTRLSNDVLRGLTA